MNPLRHDR